MKEVAVKQFTGGMNQDVNPKFSAEGSYRFALNATMEAEEGYMVSLSNELGNHSLFTLSNNLIPIGSCNTDTEKLILFSTNDSISEIGEFDPDTGIYTTLIRSSCLNFNTKYPISCLFNLRRGCERVIYFTDRFNKYRSVNLSTLTNYTSEATAFEANTNDNWDCEKFNLTPNYQVPVIDLQSVNESGGQLKVGSYQFAIQYVDNSGTSSEWFYVTNPVPILSGLQTGTYDLLVGGKPVLTVSEPEEGSVPTTTKSITISISNLDTNYPYYRLAALHSTGTIGKVTEVWYLERTTITGTQQTYTYGGPNISTDVLGSLQDIAIDNAPIHVAKAHAIVDQALWLANLSNINYDYAEFQRKASKIISTPVIKQVKAIDAQAEGDPKNPQTWWKYRGFMPDEVYAFGIQYLFKDGTWSPAFHIPGRQATADELSLLPESTNTSHLGSGEFPKWRVLNTGTSTSFAYHQTLSTTYPDIKDCSGDSIWGIDSNNQLLVGKPIRHHRFPDRKAIPIYDDTTDSINILGANFSNIEYPHSDIVGHRIVVAERGESDKTVLDNGFIVNADTSSTDSEFSGYIGGFINPNNTKVFFSPKTLFENRFLNANYFKCTAIVTPEDEETIQINVDQPGAAAPLYVDVFNYSSGNYSQPPNNLNIEVDQLTYVSPRSTQNVFGAFPKPIINKSFSNSVLFFHHKNNTLAEPLLVGLGSKGRVVAASAKINTDPYRSLSQLIYVPAESTYTTNEQNSELFGGDNFTTFMDIFDIILVTYASQTALQTASSDYYSGFWVDSEINSALRFGGLSRCNTIYQGTEIGEYFRDKLYDPNAEDNEYIVRTPETICKEYYGYNRDYHKVQIEKPAFSLSYAFNYCSECLNTFPYRIRVSQKSYLEDSLDHFKIFRDGDRTDLLGTTGPITSLKVKDDNLYALTRRGIFFVPINPQTIQTSENLLYLGTGDRLAIPPRRLNSAEYSDGGCANFLGTTVTEHGLFYIDYLSSKIMLLGSEGLRDIANEGMKKFFQNNMEFELDKQFRQVFQISYPYLDNTTYKYGLGYSIAYDPKFRRIIISKKDYRLRDEFVSQLKETERVRGIYWDGDKFIDNRRTQKRTIAFTEEEFFENRSWTISFYIPYNKWSSFHSYLPDLMFNDSRCFFTSNGTSNVWKHNDGNYQTFYNNKSDYVIDFTTTSNPSIASVYSVVDVNCNIEAESDTDNIFFNYATIYNSYQCSGKLPVEIRTNSFAPSLSNTLYATRAERSWRLSDFRDYVTDYTLPIFSKDWDDLSSNYYIDKIVNPNAVDINKSQFELARFRDTYLGCRLYFNPIENAKISTDIIASINKLSYR